MTQVEMARRLGVSQPTLARLENGNQNVTLRTVTRICRTLRCDPGDLFRPDHASTLVGNVKRRR